MKVSDEIKISDNGFLFNPNTGDSFNLNPTALDIIHLIAEDKELGEIKEAFLSKYEVDELTFEKDFYELLSLLKLHGVTVPASGEEYD